MLDTPLRGVRLGVDRSHRPIPVSDTVAAALERALEIATELGATVVEVTLPDATEVTLAASMVLLAESHAQHGDQLAAHRDEYGADVRDQLDISATVDARTLSHALHARERLTRQVERLFDDGIDAFVLPTMAMTAPGIDAQNVQIGDTVVPVAQAMASFTLLADLTRQPTIAIPCGLASDGLPTSIQITGPAGREARVLQIGHVLENVLWPSAERRPRGLEDVLR
jgi:aspartyl-tRNA(Asn)/glutamyl-tRNA(Gln) amidotransferase subunit A